MMCRTGGEDHDLSKLFNELKKEAGGGETALMQKRRKCSRGNVVKRALGGGEVHRSGGARQLLKLTSRTKLRGTLRALEKKNAAVQATVKRGTNRGNG